jgi:hypothetical protein
MGDAACQDTYVEAFYHEQAIPVSAGHKLITSVIGE